MVGRLPVGSLSERSCSETSKPCRSDASANLAAWSSAQTYDVIGEA